MTEPDVPPKAEIKTAPKSLLHRLSVVWLVPILAIVIAGALVWQNYADRGPVIEIEFANASGVRAQSTELRYRDVTVGLVEKVSFSDGLSNVLVTVRLNKDVADYVDGSAKFWVVKPEVSAQGVTGLDTVLGGVFIEGLWDNQPDGLLTHFTGLDAAPLEALGGDGLRLVLRATGDAQLGENTPILYRGIEVGRVGKPHITSDGTSAEADAVIFSPHGGLISTSTRFWDTSGFSFSLGPAGASLDFTSIASLVSGGITFDTIESGGMPPGDGHTFTVFTDESEARANLFGGDAGEVLNLTVIFKEQVAGLTTGATVMYKGLQIGKVTALNGLVDKARFGDDDMRLVATLAIQISRLGLESDANADAALAFLDEQVENAGLRARLATASILTGGLNVEFAEVPDAPPAHIERIADGNPVIPTTESKISDVSATADGMFQRINNLPIEELLNSGIELMNNMNGLIRSQDVQAMPGNVNGLVGDARALVTSDELKALAGNLNQALADLRAVIAEVRDGQVIDNASTAMASASEAADRIAAATDSIPAVVDRINAVLRQASETLSGYSASNGLGRDARSALREVEQAARDLSSLARAIERKPNSLLTGR